MKNTKFSHGREIDEKIDFFQYFGLPNRAQADGNLIFSLEHS